MLYQLDDDAAFPMTLLFRVTAVDESLAQLMSGYPANTLKEFNKAAHPLCSAHLFQFMLKLKTFCLAKSWPFRDARGTLFHDRESLVEVLRRHWHELPAEVRAHPDIASIGLPPLHTIPLPEYFGEEKDEDDDDNDDCDDDDDGDYCVTSDSDSSSE